MWFILYEIIRVRQNGEILQSYEQNVFLIVWDYKGEIEC